MNWRVKDPSGRVRESLSTEQLIWGLQQGELPPDIWLSREDTGAWQPLSAVEAFDDIASSSYDYDESAVPAGRLALGFSAVAFVFAVGWLVL